MSSNIVFMSITLSTEHVSAYITISCINLDLSNSSVFNISFILVSNFTTYSSTSPAEIEEICSIPGVDMVQFGPSDYSMSLGKNSMD